VGEVITVPAGQQPPQAWAASMFIGGSARNSAGTPWRSELIALLRERWNGRGHLVVFAPERDLAGDRLAPELAGWYQCAHEVADVVMFWWPDDGDHDAMFATLMAWPDGERAVYGVPQDVPHAGDLLRYADRRAIAAAATLDGMVTAALGKIGPGAQRTGGEREVPLPVWRTESFQRWYSAQTSAGNTLAGARQVWTFSSQADPQSLIYWALHVRIYVAAEDRIKSNEVVLSRPDISVVALYQRNAKLHDSIVVLIREFRSTASTADGFVHELPGGSGAPEADAHRQAAEEVKEETGFAIDVRRLRAHGSRQLAATVSAHHAHLFTAEITDDELARLRAAQSGPHGAGDTERTWTEITTFGEIRRKRLVDWATLGMIAETLLGD
jgi:ADP-ribose pyrophosphatase YjhB (NUDIX family)